VVVACSFDHSKFINQTTMKKISFLFAMLLLIVVTGMAQSASLSDKSKTKNQSNMKMYVIEREIPGVGQFTPEQLKGALQTSCNVLKELGPKIEWIQSYVTGNKLYCVYRAENVDLIKEHAKKGGFPANSISEVSGIISPSTATGN
jgi:hypothetical protein